MTGHVLIGGGSGFIGTALSQHLRRNGYRVTIVSRKPQSSAVNWGELKSAGLPHDCTAVISMAGQNIMETGTRWTPGFKQNVWSSRINTTQLLASAACQAETKPKVFVSLSGVAYYECSETAEYTEESICKNYDFMSQLCHDWEDASSSVENCGIRRAVIRSGVVLGRQGGMIARIFFPFFFGLGGHIGTGKQYFPWIHIDDMVGLIHHVVENPECSGVYNGVAPDVVTNQEFTQAFARAMWRFAFLPVPSFAMNYILGEERAKVVTEGQKVLPKRTLESGYTYLYPNITSACKDCSHLIYADRDLV